MVRARCKLTFQRATQEDAIAYLELEQSVAEDKKYSHSADAREILEEFRDNEVHLIYKGDRLVGSVEFQVRGPSHAYISGLIVHADFHRKRVAYEAVQFLIEKLKGFKKIELVTHPQNANILSMSKKFGFSIVRRIENYWGEGEPRLLLVREGKD